VTGGLLEVAYLAENLDVLEASLLPAGILGHSYYAENTTALSDIRSLLLEGLPAKHRAPKSDWIQSRDGGGWELIAGEGDRVVTAKSTPARDPDVPSSEVRGSGGSKLPWIVAGAVLVIAAFFAGRRTRKPAA